MRIFTVHLRRHGLDPVRDVQVVKEGFSWPALLFGGFWALWHRMWIAAVGLFVIAAGAGWLARQLLDDPNAGSIVGFGFAVLTGLVANDLRRWTLERAGFAFSGIAAGQDADEALLRFLDGAPELKRDLVS